MNQFESRLAAALCKTSDKQLPVYLAAVSGGADSVAMLAALAALRDEAPKFTLHCVHVEHGLRPAKESKADAAAAASLCEKLKVPCRIVSVPEGKIASFAGKGGPGIEGAARAFRYRALRAEARRLGAGWILTAHTQDDVLETILMRVLKGAGSAGLASMKKSMGRLLRPLLDMTRRDVLAYLAEKQIPFRTDSSNADLRFLRNRIRLKLVPLLDSVFPGWKKSILSLAETQALTAEFLNSEVQRRFKWDSGEEGFLKIQEDAFKNAPLILREEAIFAALDLLASVDRTNEDLTNWTFKKRRKPVPRRSVLRRAVSRLTTQDLGPVCLERKHGFVFVSKTLPLGEKGFSLLIKETGLYNLKAEVLALDGGADLSINVSAGIKAKAETQSDGKAVFYAKLPVVLKKHSSGDRIMRGGHKCRLSDILDTGIRSKCKCVITAYDTDGPSAFIAVSQYREMTVILRDDVNGGALGAENACSFVLGGLDV